MHGDMAVVKSSSLRKSATFIRRNSRSIIDVPLNRNHLDMNARASVVDPFGRYSNVTSQQLS